MSRNNQNSKWKAHQQDAPKSVVVKEEVKVETPKPLVPVAIVAEPPIEVEEEIKPLVKKSKKDVE